MNVVLWMAIATCGLVGGGSWSVGCYLLGTTRKKGA